MSSTPDCSELRPDFENCLKIPMSPRNSDSEASAAHNGEDDSAVESDDSNSTQEESVETILAEAEASRQQKIRLGGMPTRRIKEYRPEDIDLIPMADDHPRAKLYLGPPRPPPQRTVPWEETLYRTYCAEERMHFRSELMAWESFLRSIRRDWVKRNEEAKGTIPPPPPVLEWDPLDLHTRYLGFLHKTRTDDENDHKDCAVRSRFNFWPYHVFVDHIDAVERQVAEIREEGGLARCPSTEATELEKSRLGQTKTKPTSSLTTNAHDSDTSEPALAPKLTSTEFQLAISRPSK